MTPNTKDWPESALYVLEELKRLNNSYENLSSDVHKLREDFIEVKTELRFKSSVWGLFGAAIPVTIWFILQMIKFQ